MKSMLLIYSRSLALLVSLMLLYRVEVVEVGRAAQMLSQMGCRISKYLGFTDRYQE